VESRIRSRVFPKLPNRPDYTFLELLLSFTYPISILLGAHLTLSSTEVGRFSSYSRRLHGSHSARVLGGVNAAPLSHSSFLLGARLPNSSLRGDSPAHLRARYHQATRPVATTRHATDDFSQSSLFVEVLVDVIPRLRLFRFRQ